MNSKPMMTNSEAKTMNPQSIETEVKLHIPSTEPIAQGLEAHGFILQTPATSERSELWDRGRELFDQGCALRLRSYAGKSTLTWKGAKVEDPLLKIRPELETGIEDLETLRAILRALGFTSVLSMEKRRAVWTRSDLVACLDETPFGSYLELEGEAAAIHAAMAALHLKKDQAETRSYPTLYRDHGLA